ncbi:MAG: phosphate acyltransferase PlsX [Zetaproteobacteria bacterium]|nr:MAG: phosphate acyltransferase PlsX [Zetaproteobacteria bacterium]
MEASSGLGPRILLDGHGGDRAPSVVFDALELLLATAEGDDLQLGVVGTDAVAEAMQARGLAERIVHVPARDVIEMCDAPAVVVRRKKQSSMHVGARLLRDGAWDAFVSAGNTGALMAISKLILKTLNGIDRPAIASMIPTRSGGKTLFLDVGANVDCTSDHLLQFALMGHAYMQAAEGIEKPRVGLLNIGSEDIKGTDVIKVAAAAMESLPIAFVGNVEGTDLFSGEVDVVVCDGFVGNVALKTMEGTARFLADGLKQALLSGTRARMGAMLAQPALRAFREQFNPGRYNGAPLLGLNGIVVKSHGSADAEGLANALRVAVREVRAGLLSRINVLLSEWNEA